MRRDHARDHRQRDQASFQVGWARQGKKQKPDKSLGDAGIRLYEHGHGKKLGQGGGSIVVIIVEEEKPLSS